MSLAVGLGAGAALATADDNDDDDDDGAPPMRLQMMVAGGLASARQRSDTPSTFSSSSDVGMPTRDT